MPSPISIFLNHVKNFAPADFEQFVAGFKKKYANLKTAQSKEDNMIYGYFPGETTAEFKYDQEHLTLSTDLSATQVWQFVRNS